eukprot:3340839-Pyramimonas_sp.AAC.1
MVVDRRRRNVEVASEDNCALQRIIPHTPKLRLNTCLNLLQAGGVEGKIVHVPVVDGEVNL